MLINLGLLIWGATMLALQKSLPQPGKSPWVGVIFILISVLTLTMFWPVILYWGFEFWLLLLGWLYAAAALATAVMFIRLSRS